MYSGQDHPVELAMSASGDVAAATLITILGVQIFCQSLLVTGKAVSSICTGLGSDHIVLTKFIKPSVERVFAYYGIPGSCQLEVVSGCEAGSVGEWNTGAKVSHPAPPSPLGKNNV